MVGDSLSDCVSVMRSHEEFEFKGSYCDFLIEMKKFKSPVKKRLNIKVDCNGDIRDPDADKNGNLRCVL